MGSTLTRRFFCPGRAACFSPFFSGPCSSSNLAGRVLEKNSSIFPGTNTGRVEGYPLCKLVSMQPCLAVGSHILLGSTADRGC
jgi:hypothetical protein